jgi:NADH dehydrogenase
MRKTLEQMPRVVVVGGGFGGTHAAHTLRNAPVRVTVIDRTNHSIFHPLLYQVASAGLSSDEIAVPIRFLLRRQRNSEVMMAEVTAVDVRQRRLWMSTRQLSYDYLILATGSHYSYFGHNDWPRFAPSLKTTADAVRIRRRILQAFEQAELEMDADTVSALLTFVLIGAGPTGVEMSGALSELARFALVHEYRHIDTLKTRIVLLEAGPRILPAFPAALARKAEEELERKGVEVRIDAAATAIDEEGVIVNGGERIRSHNVIWAAGVKGAALGQSLGVETDRMGRVKVLPDLSIPDHPEIFVIGDLMVIEQNGKSFSPGLAPVAVQQGQYVGRLIARRASAESEPGPFRYRDKGSLATIGRAFATADFGGRLKFSGRFAWVLWSTVHLFYLTSLWNRIQVFATWIWAYFTYQRGVRILTPDSLDVESINGAPPIVQKNQGLEAAARRSGTVQQ